MPFGSLKIFQNSRQQLNWLSHRQRVLSQNLANVSTPGYRAKDLQAISFQGVHPDRMIPKLALRKPDHDTTLQKPLLSGPTQAFFIQSDEQKLSGNTVIPEDEVKKMNESALLHEQVLKIYKQNLANFSSVF